MAEKIIIVGGCITAISAIKAIREIDSDVEIHLFASEKYYPYNRIKLSKSLFDKLQEESMLLQKKEWYEANKVNLHLGMKVTGIDTDRQEIVLYDGSRHTYDKLLLANGAKNSKPSINGIDNKGIFTLRELNDVLNIHENIENKNVVVIIGAGSQGLETAWVLHQHGKEVIIVQRNRRLMPRELDEKASSMLQNIIEKYNIKVLLNTQFESINSNGNIECAIKGVNKIDCDMVIYSAGISPNIELLEGISVKVNKGVVVDKRMRTNIENIYAAGDVAEYEGIISGLWNIAIGQGKTAGYNMAGKEAVYEHIVPVTTLSAFGISLFSMGKVEEKENIYTLTSEEQNSTTYKRIFIEGNKIVGAIVIGDTKKSPVIKSAIENETSLESINLEDISVDNLLEKIKNKEI